MNLSLIEKLDLIHCNNSLTHTNKQDVTSLRLYSSKPLLEFVGLNTSSYRRACTSAIYLTRAFTVYMFFTHIWIFHKSKNETPFLLRKIITVSSHYCQSMRPHIARHGSYIMYTWLLDSCYGRVSVSGAGERGFDPQPDYTKEFGTLLLWLSLRGAQDYGVSNTTDSLVSVSIDQ